MIGKRKDGVTLFELQKSGGKIPQDLVDRGFHYCPEWDYGLISPKDPEFEACGCYPQAKKEDLLMIARLEVRKEWMTIMGLSLEEIAESPMPTDLQDELEQLAAAKRLNRVKHG